ncbi:MAG: hydroxysqualene dehydroxylase HpnE [Bacteroidota bacterium]|nr:hydroxysqualene dehydroxylase HpnE [Bacteroidota bacterium]
MSKQNNPDVLIIGGGVAGLAAAVDCSSRGLSVLLLEQKPRLGGRTYSFIHQETGDEVDNGQHLMMGCYHSTLKFLRLIDRINSVSIQKNLSITFRRTNQGASTLSAVNLPAPLNVFFGLLRLNTLTISERLSLLRIGLELIIRNSDSNKHLQSITVDQWLDEMKQPTANRKYLWNIISIGALNDVTDKISAALFVKVLKSAFFGKKINSSIVIPKCGLSSVLVDGAAEFIQKHQGKILLDTSITKTEMLNSTVQNVHLDGGEVVSPKTVISAVPYFDIPKIFDKPEDIGLKNLDKLVPSPIISIHLWFDVHFMEEEFVALIDSPIHWVFNKSKIYGKAHEGLMYLALVISGAHNLIENDKEQLVQMAHKELQQFYPTASVAAIVHSLIIKEKRATFSPMVGVEQFRPSNETSIKNLFLAGDWTNTKLPATIEGAVQSGFACSELVKQYLQHD